jgi:hypothetical protein
MGKEGALAERDGCRGAGAHAVAGVQGSLMGAATFDGAGVDVKAGCEGAAFGCAAGGVDEADS